jgi:hypothetical protein
MGRTRQTRSQDARGISRTGDGFDEPDDDVVAGSDVSSGSDITATSIGRTPSDLLHESGASKSLSRVLSEVDPVEVFFIGAYVILSGWGYSQHPIWPFSYFGLSILGYHLFGRPLAKRLMRFIDGPSEPKL